MPTKLKFVWNVVTTVFVVLIVVFAVLLVGVRIVGIQPYTVLSGSMEPNYHVGSLIYVSRNVNPLELKTGDPVTFMLNETTVATHRIIEVIPDENDPTVVRFRTKGDANKDPDGALVHSANVIGKPIFTIPYLGYFASYVQQPPGRYIALSGCLLLLIAALLPDLLWKKTEKAADGEEGGSEAKAEETTNDPPASEEPDAEEGTEEPNAKAEETEGCSKQSNEEQS
ncbi:MAG: signal peptidase I [Clostridia bacterium]|nr:signal peptidase I [Clostridia bacterium]